MICKNCSTEFTGQYCNQCGQQITTPITFRQIGSHIAEDIFGIDHGLIYTLKQLWINPGKTPEDYIDGKRKRYYGPIKYLIFWTAAFFVLSTLFFGDPKAVSLLDLVSNTHPAFSQQSIEDFGSIYVEVLIHHTDLFYIGMIPFVTLVGYWFYKQKGYGFAELLIPYLYLFGQIVFLLVITLPLVRVFGNSALGVVMATGVVALFYLLLKMHRQLFKESWTKTVVKSIIIIYLGQTIYVVLVYSVLNAAKLL